MINRKTITEDAARLRMADLCARSEQCSADISAKLRSLLDDESARKRVLRFLTENSFIDDSRFAAAFARDKVRFSGWGRNKIRMALTARHIDRTMINDALEAVDPADYEEALLRAARAKARLLDPSDFADRQRLIRHLASRGFTSSECTKAARIIQDEEDHKTV